MNVFKLLSVIFLLPPILNLHPVATTTAADKTSFSQEDWSPKCPQDGRFPIWVKLRERNDFLDDEKKLVAIRSGKIYYCSGEAIGHLDLRGVQEVSLENPRSGGKLARKSEQPAGWTPKCPEEGKISIWIKPRGSNDYLVGEMRLVAIRSGAIYFCSAEATDHLSFERIEEISFERPRIVGQKPPPPEQVFSDYQADKKADIISPLTLTHSNLSGTVFLSVVLRGDLTVGPISVISSEDQRLDPIAIDAARKIKFIPAVKAGKVVSVEKIVQFKFNSGNPGQSAYRMTPLSPIGDTPIPPTTTTLRWSPVPEAAVYQVTVDYSSDRVHWKNHYDKKVVFAPDTTLSLLWLGGPFVRWKVEAIPKSGGLQVEGPWSYFEYKKK